MKIIALYDNYEPQQFDGKVYLMADSSLAKSGKSWFLPEFAPEFTYHTHLVIRIGRLGKNIARRFAHRYVDAVTVGATVTACGIADNAIAKAFDGAAMIGGCCRRPRRTWQQYSSRLNTSWCKQSLSL